MITAKQAYAIASQWGSYMNNWDPGAVFYSFGRDDAAPDSVDHQRQLLEYTDALLKRRDVKGAERKELKSLREFFAAWTPIEYPDDFARGYVRAALWASNDNADDSGGAPLDDNYIPADIDRATLRDMFADCAKFKAAAGHLITTENCLYLQSGQRECTLDEFAGHDFWLTRNGHGSGFWDGDWKEPAATELTQAAKKFGEYDLGIGDDGRIHDGC